MSRPTWKLFPGLRTHSLHNLTNQHDLPSQLEPLPLMEHPPPVPPKDTPTMNFDRPLTAPTSGSKRKREAIDDVMHNVGEDGLPDPYDSDTQTPKRRRSPFLQNDASASEDATPVQRNVRRKKGSNNLSNMNLRHAAEQHASPESQTRGSKFQEGSLTDKPSEKPPSVFTRMIRTESGNIRPMDELMADYHDDLPTPRDSVEAAIEREKALIPEFLARAEAEDAAKKEESKGFFQFGRFAASFRPVALWNRVWNDTKEELRQQDIAEAQRKARQKAEAEAKYAQMKQAGQFGLQPVSNLGKGARNSGDTMDTAHDSGVAINSLRSSVDQQRSASAASGLMPPKDDANSRSGSGVPESSSKFLKPSNSRFHLKKPSLTNIKNDLKRVGSNLDLTAAIGNRESSSSISPIKTDFGDSALKMSASKFDLKKQQKLNKRVSDLETKLEQARKELDDALIQASPMPKLTGKYERFTPNGTLTRPKFVPGKLPSLPSERVLMAEQPALGENGEANDEAEPRESMNLKDFLRLEEVKENKFKSRERYHPARASSLVKLDDGSIDHIPSNTTNNTKVQLTTEPNHHENEDTSELKQQIGEENSTMDPNSLTNFKTNAATEPDVPAKTTDYASLDAKLKALDANVKTARKAGKPKKRKISANDKDTLFKPGTETDDDADWEVGTPKKKRKSTEGSKESSPHNKRVTRGARAAKSSPPPAKKGKGSGVSANGLSRSPQTKQGSKEVAVEETSAGAEEDETGQEDFSADELAEEQPQERTSVDSQGHPLDPVYEEEEETSLVALKDEPSKPTAKATPARYGRSGLHSRSNSPHKRSESVQAGVEEQMMTRAAEAAQNHSGRQGHRSVSPPPANGYTKITTVVNETVTVVPGANGVPDMPNGVKGSFGSVDQLTTETVGFEVTANGIEENSEAFQWPDDVF